MEISRGVDDSGLMRLVEMSSTRLLQHEDAIDETAGDSSVDVIVAYTRERIVSGEFPAGSKLLPKTLAEECGTSLIPVREALRVLESNGLVTIIRNRGAWVASLSLSELRDLYSVRIPLECEAVRRAEPLTPEHVSRLRSILAEARTASGRDDQSRVIELNRDLHMTIYERCNSPWRMRLIEQVWEHAQRYQRQALDLRDDGADEEHTEIVDHLIEGDNESAALALEAHLTSTVRLLHDNLMESGLPDQSVLE